MMDILKRLEGPATLLTIDQGTELLHDARSEIVRLIDAIWEYGEHRKSCRIDSGKECDCGFFEIIKSLPVIEPND